MKRKVLMALGLTCLVSTTFAYDFRANGLYFDILSLSKKTCEVVPMGGEFYYAGDVTVPAKVTDPSDGTEYEVVAIGEKAFFYCPDLNTVTLPNTIVEIKYDAFGANALKSINIPNSVEIIGEDAFYGTQCTTFTIPGSVKTIGRQAFYLNHQLQSITFEEGVEELGLKAVGANGNLTEINLPASLVTIGDQAFCDNTKLTDFTIPKGVVNMGAGVLTGCTKLVNIFVDEGNPLFGSVDGVLFDASLETLMEYPVGRKNTSYVVPEGTVRINDKVFYNNDRLTSVTFPTSLRHIGSYCFYGNTSLRTIVFAEGLETIDDFAFDYGNNYSTVLTQLNLPKSLKKIGKMAFAHHQALPSIVIPDGVESIDDWAFFGEIAATEVYIGTGLNSLAKTVFQRCDKIRKVSVQCAVPPVCAPSSEYSSSCTQFQNEVYTQGTLHVPAGTKELYQAAPGWMEFANIVDDLDAPEIVEVESVVITAEEGVLDAVYEVGDTCTLSETVLPSNATYKLVVWTSDDDTVATVDNGVVTFLAPGQAIITVTSTSNLNASDSVTFTVKGEEDGVDVINIDSVNGSVRYYNLQGILVENPISGGLYIKKTGNKTEKVIVR